MNKLLNMRATSLGPNHNIIYIDDVRYFLSYDTFIASIDNLGNITLTNDYDCSKTTMKYLCKFLNIPGIAKVRRLIKSGAIIVE